jgi:hypothetical protein
MRRGKHTSVKDPEVYAGIDYAKLAEKIRSELREELTSGDPNVAKKLTDLLLSMILKDSTGVELSNYIKNLNKLDLALSALKDALTSKLTPILKGSIFNTSVAANTNVFSPDLSPTDPPTTFRIYACFDTGGVLTVRRTKAGVTVGEQLNGGTALTVNAAYIFDIMVESGETINLQYSVNATALKLAVYEVPSVIS